MQSIGGPVEAGVLGARWLLSRRTEGEPFVLVSIREHAQNNDGIRALTSAGVRWDIPKNFPPSTWRGGPVLAPWPDSKVLDALDFWSERITSVCILKWLEKDAKAWLAGRRAIDVTSSDQSPSTASITDPIALAAMQEITALINLGNDLAQGNDRTDTVRRLQYLHDHGHELNAEEIEAWAVAHGWSRRGAQRLTEIVDRVNAGGSFRNLDYGPIRDRGATYKRWQAKSAAG